MAKKSLNATTKQIARVNAWVNSGLGTAITFEPQEFWLTSGKLKSRKLKNKVILDTVIIHIDDKAVKRPWSQSLNSLLGQIVNHYDCKENEAPNILFDSKMRISKKLLLHKEKGQFASLFFEDSDVKTKKKKGKK